MKCIFCKQPITNGHNAMPLKDKPCCGLCNYRLVIPARIAAMKGEDLRIRLISMDGEPQMEKNLEGVLDFVDDAGQIHVKWENGSALALNADVDIFCII